MGMQTKSGSALHPSAFTTVAPSNASASDPMAFFLAKVMKFPRARIASLTNLSEIFVRQRAARRMKR